MSDFNFGMISSLSDSSILEKGFFLWVWHADKIPPHIGCSINGHYYSLKVNGKDEGLLTSKVVSVIENKKIPSVFIELKKDFNSSVIQTVFANYQLAESTKNTCLTPITELFQCSDSIFQLSELLKYLKERGEIETFFGLNLIEDYRNLPNYTQDDIKSRLLKLENVKSEKHTSSIG
jgi:hypothetical protein